jgi:acetyl esterase/lipase
MTASVEFTAPPIDQALLRSLLRTLLRVFFHGLVRPPMPIVGQRAILRVLTTIGKSPRGIARSTGTLGGRPCEWHRPPTGRGKVMLYLHGGAYLIGGANTHRTLCAHLAERGRMDVCALDYRLAPEHPYPAARDDALAAFEDLIALGYAPEQIVMAGDSAGGNLSLITSLCLRDLGWPQPAALVCFSPLTDFTCAHLHQPPAGDPLLNRTWIQQALSFYCPPGVAHDDPGLSPQFADLHGLPALLLQVGEDEVLLNDSLRFAEKAQAAGVDVRLQRYPNLWHVFQAHAGTLNAADFAIDQVVNFLRQKGFR